MLKSYGLPSCPANTAISCSFSQPSKKDSWGMLAFTVLCQGPLLLALGSSTSALAQARSAGKPWMEGHAWPTQPSRLPLLATGVPLARPPSTMPPHQAMRRPSLRWLCTRARPSARLRHRRDPQRCDHCTCKTLLQEASTCASISGSLDRDRDCQQSRMT